MPWVPVLVGAVVGAASSAYQADVQKQLGDQDRSRRKVESDRLKAEQDRIARETKPEEQKLQEIKFGTEDGADTLGSTNEFLVTKQSGGLGGTSGTSGLGFKV